MKENRLVLLIKSFHTVVAIFLTACLGLVVYSAITGQVFLSTWVAIGLLLLEGVAFISCGWRCPLTIYAEQKGAMKGSVSDIFLPGWLARHYFSVCMIIFLISTLILAIRLLLQVLQ